ncbi:MAG: substrate-binding domain-containing protein [Anaerolinea sp.]|nr:substrate-binding domain-containing protein [Anaerolinea sp.]
MSKRRTVQLILLSLLIIVAFVTVGCTQSTAEPTLTPNEAITIGLLIPNNISFFTVLADGAVEAAARFNVTLHVREANDTLATQQAQIQEMIDQQVQAIIIVPVDTEAIVPSLQAANDAGIAIFTVDRSADTDVIIAHIASDNAAGGHMAADYLAETIGRQGNVVELTGIAGTSAAQERGRGFNEAIAAFPNIQIVAQETGNFNLAEGQQAFAAILSEHADIAAVFAHNDDMILGAIAAAQEVGRANQIVFVGFDAIDAAVTALENGELNATIAQQPAEMGRLGVETAVLYLQGNTTPNFIPVELSLITK